MTRITEENVDQYIENLSSRNKGKYITQGVAFNKECPRQMNLLRCALLDSTSFSGLAKEMLALRFSLQQNQTYVGQQNDSIYIVETQPNNEEIDFDINSWGVPNE